MSKEEAIAFVKDYFEKYGITGSDGREAARFRMEIESGFTTEIIGPQPPTLAEALALGENGPVLKLNKTAEDIASLLEAAKTDSLAHQAARNVAANIIEQGKPLPPPLAEFSANVLLNLESPKKKSGRDERVNLLRNRRIVMALELLKKYDFNPTRNQATDSNSGSDIVGAALNMSYSAVAHIYAER